MPTPALASERLEKVFGSGHLAVHAVRGVTLSVERGELVLVMGPSGSGKTTLLSMLGAMMKPTSGSILLDGVDTTELGEHELRSVRTHRIGFVFQDHNLLRSLSALENVMVPLDLAGMTRTAARGRAALLLERVRLEDRAGARPSALSGGEQQRVAVARALANDPVLILADEPTASLDSGMGREIARLLREAAHDGRAVLVVSHDDRLREIADRVLWLDDGLFREPEDSVVDPICGMLVPAAGPWSAGQPGRIVRFCSPGCRDEFVAATDS
jgi:putative ABC transport system ATP-binding protein